MLIGEITCNLGCFKMLLGKNSKMLNCWQNGGYTAVHYALLPAFVYVFNVYNKKVEINQKKRNKKIANDKAHC